MAGSSSNGGSDPCNGRMVGDYLESKLLKRAREVVDEKTRNSTIFDEESEERIPRFQMSELELGKVLGRGGFCVVNEIRKIKLEGGGSSNKGGNKARGFRGGRGGDDDDEYDYGANIVQNRPFMEENCIRKGNQARYAIKSLSDSTMKDPHVFINGIVDLAVESKFLAVIRHPNIIKMRAVFNGDPYNRGFFVILDRLYDTLTQRMVTWNKKKVQGVRKLMDRKNKKKIAFWLERVTVAYDLSSAIKYLHASNIVYRDLKPDNIGFDVRGDVKIFDFGLAKEFVPNTADSKGLYKLTGDTGSLRYMAPEVALEKPYNENVDCYSFAILLYQMLSLNTPYEGFSVNMFNKKVIKGGARPVPDEKWENWLKVMLHSCWSVDISKRYTMEKMSHLLRDEISKLSSDSDVCELLDISRKSEMSNHSR